MTTPNNNNNTPPTKFIDAHHHFLDTKQPFFTFMRSLFNDTDQSYTPEQYEHDVKTHLSQSTPSINLTSSVHMEALPDDGQSELKWLLEELIETGRCNTVRAIVASCNLALEDVEDVLEGLISISREKKKKNGRSWDLVKGVRWILDVVGPYEEENATHVSTTRHGCVDYLRGGEGGGVVEEFERGFALLGKYGLSFDLQCAPVQLEAAADLFSRYENIPVCVCHLGKPRLNFEKGDDEEKRKNEEEIEVWRVGMKALSKLKHVSVKLSMMGYSVPGWISSPELEGTLRDLVYETIDMFGVERCMIATNWYVGSAISDADGRSDVGPSPSELCSKFVSWFEAAGFDEEAQKRMFSENAKAFYRIDESEK